MGVNTTAQEAATVLGNQTGAARQRRFHRHIPANAAAEQ
jgi:hypothetical protein